MQWRKRDARLLSNPLRARRHAPAAIWTLVSWAGKRHRGEQCPGGSSVTTAHIVMLSGIWPRRPGPDALRAGGLKNGQIGGGLAIPFLFRFIVCYSRVRNRRSRAMTGDCCRWTLAASLTVALAMVAVP